MSACASTAASLLPTTASRAFASPKLRGMYGEPLHRQCHVDGFDNRGELVDDSAIAKLFHLLNLALPNDTITALPSVDGLWGIGPSSKASWAGHRDTLFTGHVRETIVWPRP